MDVQKYIRDDEDVDLKIIIERNRDIEELSDETLMIADIMQNLSMMINDQGEKIEIVEHKIDQVSENIKEGLDGLKGASNYITDRIKIFRDVSIVVGGGILGTAGFLLGPIVGIGTVVAGIAGGSAAVAGIHKFSS